MSSCGNCLYQGDRSSDAQGNTNIFCLVKGSWFNENRTCEHFREYADVGGEIRVQLATEVRQSEIEDRRLGKIVRANMKLVIVTIVVSFLLFWATVKLFDKYIF